MTAPLNSSFYQRLLLFIAIAGMWPAPNVSAQTAIEGIVLDEASGESIPFAHIVVAAARNYGGVSNIDGKYRIVLPPEASSATFVKISCVGYQSVETTLGSLKTTGVIKMRSVSTALGEVVVKAKEDPGYEIIRRAATNRKNNDPEMLEGFRFTAYNKAGIDVERNETLQASLDSSGFANARFFMMESHTDVRYRRPGKWNETVTATRVSGLRNPAFAIISNSFQPFSTYTDHINLLETDFLNPISPGSENRYVFQLTDSADVEGHKVYIIQFQPRAKVTGNYLKGSVSISSDDYAIVNFKAASSNPLNLMNFEIRQNYSKIESHWFPNESKTRYVMYMDDNSQNADGKIPLVLYSATYLQDINLQYIPKNNEFNIAQVKLQEDAGRKEPGEWDTLRPFGLDSVELNTFAVYDTLPAGALKTINWFADQAATLAAGRLRLGKFDLLFNHLLRVNRYEGLRLGAGFSTNESLIKWMSLEAYFAYGFRDQQRKYGGAANIHISRRHSFDLTLSYRNDVSEPGRGAFGRDFAYTRQGYSLRNFFTEVMNPVEQYIASITARPVRSLKLDAGLMREERRISRNAVLGDAIFTAGDVVLLEWHAALQWVPGESLIQIGNTLIPSTANYPRLRIKASGGIPEVLDATQEYVRLDFDFTHQMRLRRAGQLEIHGGAGTLWGSNVAFPYLNFGRGSNGWNDWFGFETPGYFQTMALYDFLMERYAWAGFRHNFGTLFGIEKKFTKPTLKVSYMAGIGDLSSGNIPEAPINFRQMHKPYLEGGIILSDLLRYKTNNGTTYNGFGIGAFLLHGHYAAPRMEDNLMLVLSFTNSF